MDTRMGLAPPPNRFGVAPISIAWAGFKQVAPR